MQQELKKNGKNHLNKSVQDKGMLLARLLEKAVQNKINKQASTIQQNKQINNPKNSVTNNSLKEDKNFTITSQQQIRIQPNLDKEQYNQDLLSQINEHIKANKQSLNKKSKTSSLLKSKMTSYEQHNFSFDDSMSMQPSYMTFQGQQISQMLKFIYVQLFGEQKYQSDKKRYQQIQANPDQYNIGDGQQFNKQGKMLQNICFQIRMIKNNLTNLTNDVKQLKIKNSQCQKTIQEHKQLIKQSHQQSMSKQLPKQQILEKSYRPSQQIQQQNQILHLTIKQLQQQNFVLQQSIKRVSSEYEDFVSITESQNFKNKKKLQRMAELEQTLGLRDKQIDNLLMNIGQLEIQLNNIKMEIQAKQKQGIFENNYTPKRNKLKEDNQDSIQRLSTIKEEEEPINITDFIQQSKHKAQKEIQTQNLDRRKLSDQSTGQNNSLQLQTIILQLKKLLAHKQKSLLAYQKQIQAHENEIQKYEGFISQLSSEIQVCQSKLSEANKKSYEMINRKIQTDQKYFILLNDGGSNSYNKELTYGEREDGFLFMKNIQREPSIADEVDRNQRRLIQFQKNQEITFKKIVNNSVNSKQKQLFQIATQQNKKQQTSGKQYLSNDQHRISSSRKEQKYWDQVSVSLSQYSQTQELRDIRNLTKQLSQAYDKIISLTYEVNNLKRLNANRQALSQSLQCNINQQNIKMIKQN